MRLIFALLDGEIYWSIREEDPTLQELQSMPGWFFVNPLTYGQMDLGSELSARVILISDNAALVSTNGIVLGTTRNEYSADQIPFPIQVRRPVRPEGSDRNANALMDAIEIASAYVEHLTASLRQTSKQATLPRRTNQATGRDVAELPPLRFPTVSSDVRAGTHEYRWVAAVTMEQLVAADSELVAPAIPIYEKLLLDAIHAFIEDDYRRALLYSAMSIETIAAAKLEKAYESITQEGDKKGILRVVSFPTHDGHSLRTDPVYKLLMNKSRFAERLHQVPLYLLGKSLQVDNQALYQEAVELYRTRNKIAHLGEPTTEGSSRFGLNKEDTYAALECAIEVCRLFGEDTEFPLPRSEFAWGHGVNDSESEH